MKWFLKILLLTVVLIGCGWGFFGHQKINRLAVFTLPMEMITFYKKNIDYLTEAAVHADQRRYAVKEEASHHFIDIDAYPDSALYRLPRYWHEAIQQYNEDSLKVHGILPWQIHHSFLQLKDAFLIKDPSRILSLSADLGHYVADAHVPLHTSRNYDGQLTGQDGIHAFWESRLPELFFIQYSFFVGKAQYIRNVQTAVWKAVAHSHSQVDSVLKLERLLAGKKGEQKFSFESKANQIVKVYAFDYAREYHEMLKGMVERNMQASVKMIGDLWFTAWVDGGQPDLKLLDYQPGEAELKQRIEELKKWKEEKRDSARKHEDH